MKSSSLAAAPAASSWHGTWPSRDAEPPSWSGNGSAAHAPISTVCPARTKSGAPKLPIWCITPGNLGARPDAEPRGVVQQVSDFRAPDFVLAGQTVDVRAGAADPFPFHDGGAPPRPGHVPGQEPAACAAAKDEGLVALWLRHVDLRCDPSSGPAGSIPGWGPAQGPAQGGHRAAAALRRRPLSR